MIEKSTLYIGEVYHKRHIPFEHDFRYRVFTLLLDIDNLPKLKTFSHNRFNLFSLYDKDHGPRDGSPLRPWIESAAKAKNIDLTGGKIFMLTFPRVLGYVFNPITLYFCYDKNDALKAILYQVKNTFGDQHGYLMPVEGSQDTIKQQCEKIFHVSPFIHMDCTYKFTIREPGEKLAFAIHQFTRPPSSCGSTPGSQDKQKDPMFKEQKILTATWDGKRRDLNDKALLSTLVTHPLLTLKIIAGIHWEALKLVLKGAKYIRRPPVPEKDIS